MPLRPASARASRRRAAFTRRDPVAAVGARASFRFSVPVLRVSDVQATVLWYGKHLGFTAQVFPEHVPSEFAILERDTVHVLVRRAERDGPPARRHTGWDLYLWVDGADFSRLEQAVSGAVVRGTSTMGANTAELEVRDPDGYVLCIGGPMRPAIVRE